MRGATSTPAITPAELAAGIGLIRFAPGPPMLYNVNIV
jgi:hypothetical protein